MLYCYITLNSTIKYQRNEKKVRNVEKKNRNITGPSFDVGHIAINFDCTQPEALLTNQETVTRDSIRMHVSAQHH